MPPAAPPGPPRTAGLSLPALLVSLAVLGGLAAYAVPAWQQHRISLRRVEARSELVATAQRLEGCRASLDVYDNPACTVALPITTATGSYRLEGELTAQEFRLTARPLGEQIEDACGAFGVDHRGARTVSGALPASECWAAQD